MTNCFDYLIRRCILQSEISSTLETQAGNYSWLKFIIKMLLSLPWLILNVRLSAILKLKCFFWEPTQVSEQCKNFWHLLNIKTLIGHLKKVYRCLIWNWRPLNWNLNTQTNCTMKIFSKMNITFWQTFKVTFCKTLFI